MIALKKNGQRAANLGAFAPVIDLLAYAEGQFIPAAPYKGVRVYTRKGAAKPKLDRLVRGQA